MDTNDRGSAFLLKKEDVDVIRAATPIGGKNLLEPLKSMAIKHSLPFKILEDHQVINDAEVHMNQGDLWYCLEGEVKFVYGGALVEPRIKEVPEGQALVRGKIQERLSADLGIIMDPDADRTGLMISIIPI